MFLYPKYRFCLIMSLATPIVFFHGNITYVFQKFLHFRSLCFPVLIFSCAWIFKFNFTPVFQTSPDIVNTVAYFNNNKWVIIFCSFITFCFFLTLVNILIQIQIDTAYSNLVHGTIDDDNTVLETLSQQFELKVAK
jgi:hypothetical protein